jgi:fused signal recognition particle receptor
VATVIEAETITGELIAAPNTIRAKFEVNEGEIAAMTKRVESLVVADKQSRALAWEDRQLFRKLRLSVKKREESLTEEAKAQIKSVKEVANVLLGMLTPGEDAIVAKIEFYDAMQERAKKEAEAAKQAALQKRLDAFMAVDHMAHPLLVAEMSDEEYLSELTAATHVFNVKKLKAEEEAAKAAAIEAERLEALRIEQEKIAAERAELERLKEEQEAIEWERRVKAKIEEERIAADKLAEQAKIDEANRIEREAIEVQRKAVQAERDKLAREEFLRQSKIREEHEAAERSKQEQLEAERVAAIKAEQERLALIAEAEEKARIEAMKPDIEKIRAFGDVLRLLPFPTCDTAKGIAFSGRLFEGVTMLAISCEEFAS